MTWALVTMICFRVCTPQYVELYETKAACESAGKNCVPVAQKDKK